MKTDAEKEAEERLKDFTELAKTNEGADKAVLAMVALDAAQNEERISAKKRRWAYILSFGLPPLGLAFAAWYYYSGKLGGKKVALICLILTVIGGFLAWLSIEAFFASVPPGTLEQIQTLSPDELKSLVQ
jgi:hypothetical protein